MTLLSTGPVQGAGALAPARAARPLPAQLKAGLLAQFPPRALAEAWPETLFARQEVRELVGSHGFDASRYAVKRRGLQLLLDWLEAQPGHTWQARWLASGAAASILDRRVSGVGAGGSAGIRSAASSPRARTEAAPPRSCAAASTASTSSSLPGKC